MSNNPRFELILGLLLSIVALAELYLLPTTQERAVIEYYRSGDPTGDYKNRYNRPPKDFKLYYGNEAMVKVDNRHFDFFNEGDSILVERSALLARPTKVVNLTLDYAVNPSNSFWRALASVLLLAVSLLGLVGGKRLGAFYPHTGRLALLLILATVIFFVR